MNDQPTLPNLLDERGAIHGLFTENARISQSLKVVLRSDFVKWEALTPIQQESLEMICAKLGRIMAGNPAHKDHWDDIAGYALLVSKSL